MNETALEILTHKPVKPAEVSLHVKNITNIVCSPNMKYIATWCPGNKLDILPSIYRWSITKGKLKFDKHYIIYDSINLDAKALISVSDTNHIILRVENFVEDSYNFEGWSNYIKSDVQLDAQVNEQDHEFDSLFKNKSFDKLIGSFYEEDSHYKHLEDTRIAECLNKTNLSYLQTYGKDLMNALMDPKKKKDDMNNKIVKKVNRQLNGINNNKFHSKN
ncbi:12287_t:CDS:2 [Gigaspora margarita]|uniref:12287_t:CDS:1 n=1 Tax=Gigaspora margarita TaxID=4874 RepID=A0ABM8VXD3_GIGMA|nr:12287_t:CDS:2 [Gigaspora margarita]